MNPQDGDGRPWHEGLVKISTRELAGLARNFVAADKVGIRAIKKVTRKYGNLAYEIAQTLCPVDQGFMKEHMRLDFSPDELLWELGWLEDEFTMAGLPFYPLYQEFGTSIMEAQPSIFPAHDQTREPYQAELGHELSLSYARLRKAA